MKGIGIRAASAAVGLWGCVSASAGDWTGKGGDGDIANPVNWGIATGSLSGQDIQWAGSAAYASPLTCSADVCFGRVKVSRAEPVTWNLCGKTLTATGTPAIRTEGTGTRLSISNGVFLATTTSDQTVPSLRLFMSGNTVEFAGEGTSATFHNVGIGDKNWTAPGNDNRLVVRRGAVLNVTGATTIASNCGGSGNELLVDGGRFFSDDIMKLGNGAGCHSNAIFVVNGGSLEANRFYNGGDGDAVSNTIVVADSELIMHGQFDLGGKAERKGVSGNRLVVSGASSVCTDGGNMTIHHDIEVLFVLPGPERLEGYAPISTRNGKSLTVGADVTLSFDAKSLKAVSRAGGASLPLMSSGTGQLLVMGGDSAVARWSAAADAALPGASVTFADRKLTLNVPSARQGLFLVFR